MEIPTIEVKLRTLHSVLAKRVASTHALYFDFAIADEWFARYEALRDALREQHPELFEDLPVRDRPKSSGTSDFDGRGYVTRPDIKLLIEDIEYSMALLPIAVEAESTSAKATREGVFFSGEQFDALERVREILSQAEKDLALIDGYVGESVLGLLTSKAKGVSVRILTRETPAALKVAGDAFNKQYGGLSIRESNAFHDRFVVIDRVVLYHFGASIKDLGQRGFMFSLIEERDVIESFMRKFEETWNAAPEAVTPP